MNAPDCICSPGRLPLGAFCAGRDDLEREALHDDRISIRAPRAGCDQAAATKKGFMSEFQSTRPVWGATRLERLARAAQMISIHAPRAGRDHMGCQHNNNRRYISIHAPRVGRDELTLWAGDNPTVISIHAPRVGRDQKHCPGVLPRHISIHAPRVGRDRGGRDDKPLQHISIHAPRVGRDAIALTSYSKAKTNFNPRAPCGARRSLSVIIKPSKGFQSTRPVWGATS